MTQEEINQQLEDFVKNHRLKWEIFQKAKLDESKGIKISRQIWQNMEEHLNEFYWLEENLKQFPKLKEKFQPYLRDIAVMTAWIGFLRAEFMSGTITNKQDYSKGTNISNAKIGQKPESKGQSPATHKFSPNRDQTVNANAAIESEKPGLLSLLWQTITKGEFTRLINFIVTWVTQDLNAAKLYLSKSVGEGTAASNDISRSKTSAKNITGKTSENVNLSSRTENISRSFSSATTKGKSSEIGLGSTAAGSSILRQATTQVKQEDLRINKADLTQQWDTVKLNEAEIRSLHEKIGVFSADADTFLQEKLANCEGLAKEINANLQKIGDLQIIRTLNEKIKNYEELVKPLREKLKSSASSSFNFDD